VGVLTKLGVTGPVPLFFNAPPLPDQAQQGLWRGADAGEEQVMSHGALAACLQGVGDHFHDPGTTRPVLLDVLRRLLGR